MKKEQTDLKSRRKGYVRKKTQGREGKKKKHVARQLKTRSEDLIKPLEGKEKIHEDLATNQRDVRRKSSAKPEFILRPRVENAKEEMRTIKRVNREGKLTAKSDEGVARPGLLSPNRRVVGM